MLKPLDRAHYADFVVTDVNSADERANIMLPKGGVVRPKACSQKRRELVDQRRHDTSFGVSQLALKHNNIGLNLRQLLREFTIFARESWIACGKVTLGGEVQEAIDAAFKEGLAPPQLAQLFATQLDRI